MPFNSPEFILGFQPLALGGFFLAGRRYGTRSALVWLVAAGLVFYGWWNPRYTPLLVGSVGANHLLGQRMLQLAQAARAGTGRPGAARCWLVGGVGFNLGLLGWFKYADFLLHVAAPHAAPLGIVLPLAIRRLRAKPDKKIVDGQAAIPSS